MRTISDTLLNAQILCNYPPAVKLEIQEYGHPTSMGMGIVGMMELGKLCREQSENIRPNGDGNLTQLSVYPASPTTHYDKVDEEYFDDNDYLYVTNTATYKYDRLSLQNLSGNWDNITSVIVHARCKATDVVIPSVKLGLYIGTTEYGLTAQSLTTEYADYSETFVTNPATGTVWTYTDINAMYAEIGLLATLGNSAYCSHLWVDVQIGVNNQHGVAIGTDGSLNRVKIFTTGAVNNWTHYLYHQRIATPTESSDYSTWALIDSWTSTASGTDSQGVAIATNPASATVEMMMACHKGIKISGDNGATWGSWTETSLFTYGGTTYVQRCSLAYKTNGDCAVAWWGLVPTTIISLRKRLSGVWQTRVEETLPLGHYMKNLAMYYDGDWNIVAIYTTGISLSIWREIYGDGGRFPAGEWAGSVEVAFTETKIITPESIRIDLVTWRTPVPPTQILYEPFSPGGHLWGIIPVEQRDDEKSRQYTRGQTLQYTQTAHPDAADYGDGIYIVKTSQMVIMSLFWNSKSFFYRLEPGTDFYDALFSDAVPLENTANYGMALAANDDLLYATQPTEVWRRPVKILWEPPTIGSGAGDKITISQEDIIEIRDQNIGLTGGDIVISLDNSDGHYANLGTGGLAVFHLGSRVNIFLGYNTGTAEYSECDRRFIEEPIYTRNSGRSVLNLHCLDAWGLLERYKFPQQVEWNVHYEQYTVYQMIELILQSIGATLSYDSRSSLMTTLYPKTTFDIGSNAADAIRMLLRYTGDVIKFFGLVGYIVYPQSSDVAVYSYVDSQ